MQRYKLSFLNLLFLFALLIFSDKTIAQTSYKISGIVADTASNLKLQNAVVSVLNAKDSILIGFKRSDVNGSFHMEAKQPGSFLMMVSYPGYLVYVEHFVLNNDKKVMDFKTIHLNLKSRFLKEIIVKGEAIAIKIKSDTTEFNAGSYVIQPHAKVEDLLKQLPGLQIDQNGTITANGETVKKVLLDGEEFFGDDPTLVTRNIRGDMVDKVQLYDKKSDQATFTEIEDGKKEKTINIKLKESANNGYFGKVEAGKGNDGFYQGQAMLNRFKSNNKFAFYGLGGNNGKVGLGWQDNEKYGSSSIPQNSFINLDDVSGDDFEAFNGTYNGQGLPSALITGVHFDTHWGQKKKRINLNYKIGAFGLEGIRDRLTQNNLPFGLITDNSAQQFTSNNFRQKLDATYETELDSTTNLKVSVFGSVKKLEGNTAFQTFAIKDSTTFLNASTRNIGNIANDVLVGSSAFVSKKFKTNRRTASLQIDYTHQNRNSEQLLLAKNSFYDSTGIIESTQKIDQKKPEKINFTTLNSNTTYTEPLLPSLSLVVNAGISFNRSLSDRKSYNSTAPNIYTAIDSLLSNNFRLQQNIQQLGAVFNYNKRKNIVTAGLKTLFSDYTQKV